jgi:hypothetical protein
MLTQATYEYVIFCKTKNFVRFAFHIFCKSVISGFRENSWVFQSASVLLLLLYVLGEIYKGHLASIDNVVGKGRNSLFFEILGFEFRALSLMCRHSATGVTLPALFALVILEMGSCSLPGLASNSDLPSYASCSSWNDRHAPCVLFFLLRWGLMNFFAWAGLEL